jgi:hypothetical protein
VVVLVNKRLVLQVNYKLLRDIVASRC